MFSGAPSLIKFLQVIVALVPPPNIAKGWACFCGALVLLIGLTAVVGDLAGIFGCLIGLEVSDVKWKLVVVKPYSCSYDLRLLWVSQSPANGSIISRGACIEYQQGACIGATTFESEKPPGGGRV